VNCNRPLDPLDLEAIASGENPLVASDAAEHLEICGECARRLESFREIGHWLDALAQPDLEADLAGCVERLRTFSRAERRDFRIWAGPAALFTGLVAASGMLLSMPILTSSEQVGILSALPRAIGLEWRSLVEWPVRALQALPGCVGAASQLAYSERKLAGAAILLLIPAGFAMTRLWVRRRAFR
jgi:hypothetical protein